MATKSDNTQGNPYHDEEGKFTTPNGGGIKSEELVEKKIDSSEIPQAPRLKLKGNVDLEGLRKKVAERQSVSRIPFLQSATEIENHIEEFFPEPLIKEVETLYDFSGNSYDPYNHNFFRFDDGSVGLKANIFVTIISKYRYPQQYCDYINNEEYNALLKIIDNQGSGKFDQYYDNSYSQHRNYYDLYGLAKDTNIGCGLVKGYRGVNFQGYHNWESKLQQCLDSYIGLHGTQPSYSGQGNHGTVNYVAMSKRYAYGYDGNQGHILKHIIDVRDARVLYQPQVEDLKRDLVSNSSAIQKKLEQHFSKYMDTNKAQKLALGVVGSIRYDLGTTCVLMGGDVLIAGIGNGNQIDVLNWKVAKILKDW